MGLGWPERAAPRRGAAAGALLRGGGAPATVSRGEWAGELPGNEVKLVRGFARVGMGRRGGLRVS